MTEGPSCTVLVSDVARYTAVSCMFFGSFRRIFAVKPHQNANKKPQDHEALRQLAFTVPAAAFTSPPNFVRRPSTQGSFPPPGCSNVQRFRVLIPLLGCLGLGFRALGLFRALSMSGRPLLAGGRRRVAPTPHISGFEARKRPAASSRGVLIARPRGLAARPPGALIERLEVCRGCLEGLERFWRVGRAVGWSGSRWGGVLQMAYP